MSRIVNDLMDISEFAHHGPEDLFISLVSVVGSFIILCTINIPLTLITFAVLPFLILFVVKKRTAMTIAFRKNRIEIAEVNASLENSIAGVRVARAFTGEQEEAKKFDMVISYDKGDARMYNYVYHPTFMSKIPLEKVEEDHSDFCFVGLPKNRLDKIYDVYLYLSSLGYKCDFVISGLKGKEQRISGIKYIGHDMSYYDYLQHVVNSDCIVEIMQENAQGFTLRTWEALLYNKKLLTNNADVENTNFYNPSQIIVFDDIRKISTDSFHEVIFDSHDFVDTISPNNLFKLIDSKL